MVGCSTGGAERAFGGSPLIVSIRIGRLETGRGCGYSGVWAGAVPARMHQHGSKTTRGSKDNDNKRRETWSPGTKNEWSSTPDRC